MGCVVLMGFYYLFRYRHGLDNTVEEDSSTLFQSEQTNCHQQACNVCSASLSKK